MLIDLTLNKVIKSTVPVFVVVFSVIVEKKKYTWQVIVCLLFLSFGTILSCLHSSDNGNNPLGIVMAIGSSAVGGGGIVMSALLLGKARRARGTGSRPSQAANRIGSEARGPAAPGCRPCSFHGARPRKRERRERKGI